MFGFSSPTFRAFLKGTVPELNAPGQLVFSSG